MKKILSLLMVVCFSGMLLAQNGTLRGKIIDDATGEEMFGVNVVKDGTTTGTIADLEGNYNLQLEPGTHTIVFSYISYATQKVSDVVIKPGEVTMLNIRLKEEAEQIEVVTVTAKRLTNTENALLTVQKKSAGVLDGISAESFSKTGDGDAAAAIKRVTGVSVEGGKYVYVRGLGDRYTKTQLNGIDIPGLDPDRNTVQMDIFPSNLLDNIVVYKSFTPDLPGDFTGGMVNIVTKDFPDKSTFNISASLGYNPDMNLKKGALRYKGGAGTFFAFGNKYRSLPISEDARIPSRTASADPELTNITRSFNSQLAPTTFRSPLNGSFSVSRGNQIVKGEKTLGYVSSFNYGYNVKMYKFERGLSIKDNNDSITNLQQINYNLGNRTEQEVTWSGMLGGSIKTKTSKYSLSFLHSQAATTTAAQMRKTYPQGQNSNVPQQGFVLDYSQRSVSNMLLKGEHAIKADKWKLEWKISPTYSKITEPDIRSTFYLDEGGVFNIDNGDGAVPERFYRSLFEINGTAKMDISTKFKLWNNQKSKLKFGFANTYKYRDYQILSFIFNSNFGNSLTLTGNGDELMEEQNLWSNSNPTGTYIQTNETLNRNSNVYQATQNIGALYVMNELPLHERFKVIYGLRYERTDNWISGFGNIDGLLQRVEGRKTLSENDFLPAVNLVYTVIKNMNLRFSYSRTVARPSFKEKSFVSILDPISDVRFNGNIDLEKTNIENLDLRWEYFFNSGEIVSVSGFYKHFNKPIEIAGFLTDNDQFTPRNAGKAHVFGAELEFRKNFGFINSTWKNLSFGTNLTYVKSLIDMNQIVVGRSGGNDVTEYQSRSANLRQGETLNKHRSMFGQSPFIVNTFLNYSSKRIGLDWNLSYNVQGKRLAVVGIGVRPDVYEQPFHALNFKISQKFGKDKRWKASLNAQNLINDKREKLFESFNTNSQVFERYAPGRTFTLGFSYTVK